MTDIFVVQRHTGNLEGIRSLVDKVGTPNNIQYFNFPDDVISVASNADIIVSGNVFESMRYKSGKDFARDLKRLHPEVFFIMYSTMPMRSACVDAYIDKPCGTGSNHTLHKPLVDVITHPSIGDLLRSRDFEKIRKMFPQIEGVENLPRNFGEQAMWKMDELFQKVIEKHVESN